MKHKAKVKLARRIVKEPEQFHGIFNSLAWRRRKYAIMQRVKRQEVRRRYHKEVKQGVR